MKINGKNLGEICVVELEGEIDAEHSAQLKSALAKYRETAPKKFVVDLSKVRFIDSTGLGIMISLMRSLNEQGGKLRLSGLNDEVRSIFQITRLHKVFDLNSNLEEAIRDFQKK